MANNIQQYISSGILEAYVLGSLTEQEEREVLLMKKQYPVVNEALAHLESDMEQFAMQMAINPPPALWERIEGEINDIIKFQEAEVVPFGRANQDRTDYQPPKPEPQFIEVEAQSNHIKVHKLWRWAFLAVFILGKIFLATAIYFYIENRHNQQEVQELKTQMQQLQQLHR